MIYKVKYTVKDEDGNTLNEYFWEIDDLVLFDNQPDEFKALFNKLTDDQNMAWFDDSVICLLPSDRIIINIK